MGINGPKIIIITDDCISCGACEHECPMAAISEGEDQYHIDIKKCNKCAGYFEDPACAEVCVVNAILA